MGSNAFGAPSSSPYGAPPSPSLSFGAPQQPPRFSAGSLISDSDLPDWLRAGPGGQGAQPAQAPVAAQSPQAPWGAPAQPAQVQGWPSSPAPRQPEIDAQHTIRQPAFGAPAPAAQPTPFGQPQQGYAQQPYGQPGLPSPYAQPPASFGQPSRQSGYGQPSYPQQMGQPQQPAGYPQQPAYGQQPASYPQAPASGNYGGFPAFAPQQAAQQAVQVNAFPSIEQAGSAYNGPQVGGMAGHALLDQRALPNWLAGGAAQPGVGQAASRPQTPSGMQARSLVDDQALPKWLRDQPDDAGQANASAWIGAPAAHEPMRPALNETYARSQVARPPQPSSFGAPAAPAQNAFGASSLYQPPSPMRGDEAAMPDWLRAQAGNAPANAAAQGGAFASAQMDQQPSVGFAASDLIDPAALPDWVTGRAPAAPTFSSTQGWSVAQPEPDASYAAAEYHGGEQGFGQSYQQDYGQGYGQDGYDQQPEDSAYGGEESAQGVTWENAAWGESEAQDVSAYNLPPSPQKPLAPEELPPWLRGKGGAAAADPRAAAPARNPWANAASPVDSIDGWNDDEPWDDGDDQSGQQRWDAAPTGRDNRAGSAGYGQQQMTGWNDAEASMDWGEPAHARTRDPYDQYSQYGQREPRAAGGYADDLYGRGYDQMAGDYGDYGEYDDEYEDDEAQSARKGGRGWLGFLRRDKR